MTGQSDAAGPDTPAGNAASQNFTELRSAITNVERLGRDVRSGRVVLDPEVGASLLAALRSHFDDVGDWQSTAGNLAHPLPMGKNQIGDSMSGKFYGRVVGRDTALATVLAQYRDAVSDACDAVSEAMRQYAAREDAVRGSFNRMTTT